MNHPPLTVVEAAASFSYCPLLISQIPASSGHGIWIKNWTARPLCSLVTYTPHYSASCPLHFRSRLCPLSSSSVRSCVLWIWAITACRRCHHASENSPAWPSWSWEGTVWSVSLWNSASVGCWRGAVWWWRRTCSTRCHQKSKNSFGGLIRSKLEPNLSGELQRREVWFKKQTSSFFVYK